jgi:hypothetical protein
MSAFFYSVHDSRGIDPLKIPPLLTVGRLIRWQSSNGEHGLIEAAIAKTVTNPLDYISVIDAGRTKPGSIYIERVKEIALTEAEAKSFNLGWPYLT